MRQVVLGIFCCTEGEAVRLGRLLRETIATLESWRSNKDVYLRECSSKRGMAASFSDTSKRVPFDQFPRLLYKWYLQTTKVCLPPHTTRHDTTRHDTTRADG